MANRWGNSENSERLFFLGLQITADSDCSHEIKRSLLLGRKVMINLDSILKSRDITLSAKVCLVKSMVFLVVIYGHESSIIKKAEHQELMLLNCGVEEHQFYTWCEELTHLRKHWCWERLKAGGEGDDEDEMVGWHHQLNDMSLSKLWELVMDREA